MGALSKIMEHLTQTLKDNWIVQGRAKIKDGEKTRRMTTTARILILSPPITHIRIVCQA